MSKNGQKSSNRQKNQQQEVKKNEDKTNHPAQEPEELSQTQSDQLIHQFQDLKEKLAQTQEREKRSLADYQNLLRRTREERSKAIRMANQELISELLPALENLDRASEQIDDEGLNLVVNQIWSILNRFGLEKIEAKGKEFDVNTMEAASQRGEGNQVVEVIRQGYKLKDKVIQHAKVVLGSENND